MSLWFFVFLAPVSALKLNMALDDDQKKPNATARHRVAWVHIPKCASSFGTTLAHYANWSLPPDVSMLSQYKPPACIEKQFLKHYPPQKWFNDLLWLKGDGNWGNHVEISESVFAEFKGDFFGMFRHPASRAISSWHHVGGKYKMRDYAHQVEGMATKMIAGQEGFSYKQCCTDPQIKPDVDKAIERLQAFRFVGLVEEYDLSICLFHAMLGGKCLKVEFSNSRPGNYEQEGIPNETAMLNDYVDPFDLRLYESVQKIFWDRINQYKVTPEKCRTKICPAAAEHFALRNGRYVRYELDESGI